MPAASTPTKTNPSGFANTNIQEKTPQETGQQIVTPFEPGEAPPTINNTQETRLRTLITGSAGESEAETPQDRLRALGCEIRDKEVRLEQLLSGRVEPKTKLGEVRDIKKWHGEIKQKQNELNAQIAEQKKIQAQMDQLTFRLEEMDARKKTLTRQRDELDKKILEQNAITEKPAAKPVGSVSAPAVPAAPVAPAADTAEARILELKEQLKDAEKRLNELADEKKPLQKAKEKAKDAVKKERQKIAKQDKDLAENSMKFLRHWAGEFNIQALNDMLSQCAGQVEIPRELQDQVTDLLGQYANFLASNGGENPAPTIAYYRLFLMYATTIFPGYAAPFVNDLSTIKQKFFSQCDSADKLDELRSDLARQLTDMMDSIAQTIEDHLDDLTRVAYPDDEPDLEEDPFGSWPGPQPDIGDGERLQKYVSYVQGLKGFCSRSQPENHCRHAERIVDGLVDDTIRQARELLGKRNEQLEKRGGADAQSRLERISAQHEEAQARINELRQAINFAEKEAMKAKSAAATPKPSNASVEPSLKEAAPAADLHVERSKMQGRLDDYTAKIKDTYASCQTEQKEQHKKYMDIETAIRQLKMDLKKLNSQVDVAENKSKRELDENVRDRESKIEALRTELKDIKNRLAEDARIRQIISPFGWKRALEMHLDMRPEQLKERLSTLDRASQYTSLGTLLEALAEIHDNAERRFPGIMQAASRQEYEAAGGDAEVEGRRCPHSGDVGSGLRKGKDAAGNEVVEEFISNVSKYGVKYEDEHGRAVIDHIYPWGAPAG